MEREIRFRVHLQNVSNGPVVTEEFSYQVMFLGSALEYINQKYKGYYIIGVSQFTGRVDFKFNRIFENDIVEFDPEEWGDSTTNIHKVTWDNEQSAWNWGGGTASDMHFRTVIGNRFNNPDLWEKL